ncbi:hypothetical protein D3C85_1095070 [compost metagenome]
MAKGWGSGNGAFKQFEGIDLVVAPGTKISKNVEDLVIGSRGSIKIFDVKNQTLNPWVR